MSERVPAGASSGPSSKVAIPRLEPAVHSAPRPKGKERDNRAVKACTQCRKRSESGGCGSFVSITIECRTDNPRRPDSISPNSFPANTDPSEVKCSGQTPRCDHCESGNLNCYYEAARKDRLKNANDRNQDLAALLQHLGPRVGQADQHLIRTALANNGSDDPALQDGPRRYNKRRRPSYSTDGNLSSATSAPLPSARASPARDLDHLDDNLLADLKARETGYVGQNSAVQWMRRLQSTSQVADKERLGSSSSHSDSFEGKTAQGAMHPLQSRQYRRNERHEGTFSVGDFSFYLDSNGLAEDVMVDPFQLPAPDVADKLFDVYISVVHASFPLLPLAFVEQFRKYNDATRKGRSFPVPNDWRARLNLVFAIGARHLQLIDAAWRDDLHHQTYMNRAVRLLRIKDAMLILAAPELDNIQAIGLLSFYYLVIGHVSRAWVMIGVAIRLSLALGLHLRNDDASTDAGKKDTYVRIWWSLHSIECLLSVVTGRPCVLGHEDYTAPLPLFAADMARMRRFTSTRSSDRGQSRSESYASSPSEHRYTYSGMPSVRLPRAYMDAHFKIGLLTQKALASLYAPRAEKFAWVDVQQTILGLLDELERWRGIALYEELEGTPDGSPERERELILLRCYYISTQILITRPCLCRLQLGQQPTLEQPDDFTTKAADVCVRAAQDLASLLPREVDLLWLYMTGPWWSILHSIMQALAVLLLKMSHQRHLASPPADGVSTCVGILMQWLRAMTTSDEVSQRAYAVVEKLLQSTNPRFHSKMADLLDMDEQRWPPLQNLSRLTEQTMEGQSTDDITSNNHLVEMAGSALPAPSLEDAQLFANVTSSLAPIVQDQMLLNPANLFSNPFATSFDQVLPFSQPLADPAWQQPVSTAFPNANVMEGSVQQPFDYAMSSPTEQNSFDASGGRGGPL